MPAYHFTTYDNPSFLQGGLRGGFSQLDSSSLTQHARARMIERNVTEDDILHVLLYGQSFNADGVTIFFLDKGTEMPADELRQLERLHGTAVVVAYNPFRIITTWRNRRHGLRNIRRRLRRSGYFTRPRPSSVAAEWPVPGKETQPWPRY